MVLISYNDDSLRRHEVSHEEVQEALADSLRIEVQEGESNDGNPTTIWIGATLSDGLLEIGFEYLEDEDHIYHCDNCRSHYRARYGRRERPWKRCRRKIWSNVRSAL